MGKTGWADVLWRIAVSPVTFVVLSLLWCLDLALGSFMADARPRIFGTMDAYPFADWLREVGRRALPDSLWVYLLVVLSWLMVLSLVLCTANWFFRRRRKMRGVGEVLVHAGFLLVFAGFVLGAAFGTRAQGVLVPQGNIAEVPGLGIQLRLDGIQRVATPDGRLLDTPARVTVMRGRREEASGVSRVNHPLIWGPTVVYSRDAVSRISGGHILIQGEGEGTLGEGQAAELSDGRLLTLRTVVQEGERVGPYQGPGFIFVLRGKTGNEGSAFLSLRPERRGATLGGVAIVLEEMRVLTYGVFDVHRDPGIWLVLAGGCILGLGTLWSLAGYLGIIPGSVRE